MNEDLYKKMEKVQALVRQAGWAITEFKSISPELFMPGRSRDTPKMATHWCYHPTDGHIVYYHIGDENLMWERDEDGEVGEVKPMNGIPPTIYSL